jgi:hypothetical protein
VHFCIIQGIHKRMVRFIWFIQLIPHHSFVYALYYLHRALFNNSQITHQQNALYFHFSFLNPYICFGLYNAIFRGITTMLISDNYFTGPVVLKPLPIYIYITNCQYQANVQNTEYTQKNGAVSIVFIIESAPFFCVYPVHLNKT